MAIRVTPRQFTLSTIRNSQLRNRELLKIQNQLSTGLKIQKPSDAPSKMVSLMSSRATVSRIDVGLDNIDIATGKLNQSVSHLENVGVALRSAQGLAQDGVQSAIADRKTLATGVQGVLDLVLQIANSSDAGNAVFGGTSNELNPFSVVENDGDGRPSSIEYTGTSERSSIVIGSIVVDVNYGGDQVFGARERSSTEFLGDTGVQSGSGTDSATDRGTLIVSRTGTEYRGNSGIVSGASSDQDTLVGVRELNYDAVAGTISLKAANSEESVKVSFEAGDRDVRVAGRDGEVIYVDTLGLVGSGTIEVVGSGTLSVDDGATSIDIDFSSNQVVIDSRTGAVTNVDTSNVRKAGIEHIEYSGTSDVFQTLINLRDDLLNTRNLEESQYQAAMQRHLGELDRVMSNVLDSVGEQAASLTNLVSLKARSDDYKLETQIQISGIESVDLADAVIRLQTEQNALQFTYAVSAGLMDLSILDFLR